MKNELNQIPISKVPFDMYDSKSSFKLFVKRCIMKCFLEWKAYRTKTCKMMVEKDLPKITDESPYEGLEAKGIARVFRFGVKPTNNLFQPIFNAPDKRNPSN